MTDNAKTVQTIYEAFGRGDVPFILEQLADDVRWEDHFAGWSLHDKNIPYLTARRGVADVVGFFEALAPWTVHEVDVMAIIGDGDRIVAEFAMEATQANGRRFRDEELHLWEFDGNGKVTRFRHYCDTAKHVALNAS
jgi:uncharacterized protein